MAVSTDFTITPLAYLESFSTPWGVLSLEHGVNRWGLRTQTSATTEVAKYPLHLGGVKQWLKEDLLNSLTTWPRHPLALYDCESCTKKKEDKGRLSALEMWLWIRVLRVRRTE